MILLKSIIFRLGLTSPPCLICLIHSQFEEPQLHDLRSDILVISFGGKNTLMVEIVFTVAQPYSWIIGPI